jgi:glycosyltransferase involved in cell wall biosynthesis
MPVVATDRGQISDLVIDGRGSLVESGNTQMFAEAIVHELERLKEEPDLGTKCREWVLENATWKMRAQQILEAVEAVK